MTVGICSPTIRNGRVSVSHGAFRIEGDYDPTVRVPEVVLKSVGFIGEMTERDSAGVGGDLVATGFFVSTPFRNPVLANKRFVYFVTAAHVAKDLSDKPIYFLVNKRGGGVTSLDPMGEGWIKHPTDPSADIAVVPLRLNPEADVMTVAEPDLVRPFDLSDKRVGIGDEVFITGLFTAAPGESRNMPIVRHGNLAMVPEEQIQTEMGFADVYLVEARSIGGLSGSPVFVRTADYRSEGLDSTRGIKLLGLMHGHWDIRESEINQPSIVHDRQRGVNLGIGIVVPAIKIVETINSPQAAEWRDMVGKAASRKSVPGTDIARKSGEEEHPLTQQEFGEALKKASRKIEPSASDKSEK